MTLLFACRIIYKAFSILVSFSELLPHILQVTVVLVKLKNLPENVMKLAGNLSMYIFVLFLYAGTHVISICIVFLPKVYLV